MCTPRLRWMPAQRMHMNTPRFQEAQRGPTARHGVREPTNTPPSAALQQDTASGNLPTPHPARPYSKTRHQGTYQHPTQRGPTARHGVREPTNTPPSAALQQDTASGNLPTPHPARPYSKTQHQGTYQHPTQRSPVTIPPDDSLPRLLILPWLHQLAINTSYSMTSFLTDRLENEIENYANPVI